MKQRRVRLCLICKTSASHILTDWSIVARMREIMNRLDWLCIKALVLSLMIAGGSFLFAHLLSGFSGSPILSGIAKLAPWILMAGGCTAVVIALYPVYVRWRWQRGDLFECFKCFGPLGFERGGRYGPYRRCLCCQSNISARYYN